MREPGVYPAWMRAVTLCEQCPEFKEMRKAIFEGKRQFQSGLVGQLLQRDDSAEAVRQQGASLLQVAMKRAHAHKRKCLLCSNIKAAGSSRTFVRFRV
jgi:hypothetical protein